MLQTLMRIKYMPISFFDGDDEVFDGQPIAGGGAWSNVNCKFSTTLEYNGTGDGAKPGEHAVTILGKAFL